VRFGHLNLQFLREAVKSGAIRVISIRDINDVSEKFVCEICVQMNISHQALPKRILPRGSR